jgi:hypothetical protein
MEALAGVDLEVGQDEFVCLIDPPHPEKVHFLNFWEILGIRTTLPRERSLERRGCSCETSLCLIGFLNLAF